MNTQNRKKSLIPALGIALALIGGTVVAPQPASAQGLGDVTKIFGGGSGRQGDKNLMRNLGIGLGALAATQVIKGKTTNALILGAGAAYAGKKYEDARKAQTKENDRDRFGWRRARTSSHNTHTAWNRR